MESVALAVYEGLSISKVHLFAGGFLNNSQIEVFFWPTGKLFFFGNFSHGIYSMYVPESMCMVRHTGKPLQIRAGLFYSRR